MTDLEKIERATRMYRARQERQEHPRGSFDRAGRFWLDDDERQACCGRIRTPSRAWPYSEIKHARSAEHVAAVCDVDVHELRRAIRAGRWI